MIYMELAEQGLAVAQLNAGILLDKYNIIGNTHSRLLIGQVVKRDGGLNMTEVGGLIGEFNINKHLAFKYFKMARAQRETEDEASLKLGDFYYYG
jgi:TPR repeat protein